MIMGAYCVGKVHNMLPRLYYDNGSILCRKGTQYATMYYDIRSILCR